MRLVIAEKPSLAKAISDVLPAGTDIRVTHCYGHMLELAEPAAYNKAWAKWNLADLPIRVERWKHAPKPAAAKQLNVIKDMMASASEIIHAGDPDREGQLLVDEILEHFGWRGPVKRLLINAADPASVRKALSKIEDNSKFQGLRQSAECRQRADWLVGMNLTRAVTKLLSPDILVSIGRVQTPTLALVVNRRLAIQNFVSESFYTLRGCFALDGGRKIELKCEPDPRIKDEKLAKAIATTLKGVATPMVVQVTEQKRLSPLPYHLGDFQKAAERHFGWSMSRALEALQGAYEAKLTSYPRVECRYLPREQMGDALAIAGKVMAGLSVPEAILKSMAPKQRVYDTAKVEVHHGIIPTGLLPPAGVSDDAHKAWQLVSLNFLRTLLPDERYEQTSVFVSVTADGIDPYDDLNFTGKTEKVLNAAESWNVIDLDALLPPPRQRSPVPVKAAASFPPMRDGELATMVSCVPAAGKTEPPKPYTESSLGEDMMSVAKYATDPKVKATLKETSGIGTPATRANVIETLKERGYIRVANKHLEPTELGMEIIRCIPTELADAAITAAWEDALTQISSGKYDAAAFMQRVDLMIERRIKQTSELREAGVAIKAEKPVKKAVGKKGQRRGSAGDGAQAPRTKKASPRAQDSFRKNPSSFF